MNPAIPLALALIIALAGGALWYASQQGHAQAPAPSVPYIPPAGCGDYPNCGGDCPNGECTADAISGICGCYNCSLKAQDACGEGTCPAGRACALNVTRCDCMIVGGIVPDPDTPPVQPPVQGGDWCSGNSLTLEGLCNLHNAEFHPKEVVVKDSSEYCKATTTGKAFYFNRDFTHCIIETESGQVVVKGSRLDTLTKLDPAYCARPVQKALNPYVTTSYIAHQPFDYCIPGSTLTHTDYYTGREHTATGVIDGMSDGYCKVRVDDLNNPAQPYTVEYLLDADGVAVYKSWKSGSATEIKDYRTRKITIIGAGGTNTHDMSSEAEPDCAWDFANFP